MQSFHIMTRRGFLDRSFKIGLGVALSTLTDIPLVVKRALAEGNIGLNNKKLLFIFLRGANDSINSLIPIQDSAYNTDLLPSGQVIRPQIAIAKDIKNSVDYSASNVLCDDPTTFAIYNNPSDPNDPLNGTKIPRTANAPTFSYDKAIAIGNGFAALHPSLKFLAPVYNAGDVALVHRVAYPKQSRSHFDSQNYWENGNPNNNTIQDGIFYRTMIESGLASTNPLTGVSVQSALPLILRGSGAAMTNLSDPTRYNLLGIPNNTGGNAKADKAILDAAYYPFSDKQNRNLLSLQYKNMSDTLAIFSNLFFDDAHNTFQDDVSTDSDAPYYLFPTSNQKNGGAYMNGRTNDTTKYVVDSSAYSFFTNLKAAAIVLNKTSAIIAGTELGSGSAGPSFDTHNNQGSVTGTHPNLQRRIAWALYALRKYFLNNGDKCTWNNLVVVTLSEFGRTTKQNTSLGTDHAEAGVMFLAGGGVKGYNKGNSSGVFNCAGSVDAAVNPIQWVTGLTGSMFAIQSNYLRRSTDYRSLLGKLIRDHLGATQNQLNRIIPGYATEGTSKDEHLRVAGTSGVDGTSITGELNII